MKRTRLSNGWHMVDDRETLEVDVVTSSQGEGPAAFPFPGALGDSAPHSVEDVLRAADEACRRMEFLARELECLGNFDDDEGPRAA